MIAGDPRVRPGGRRQTAGGSPLHREPHLVDSSRNTWGWFLILRGVAQGLVTLGVWARVGVRWIGVAIASAKAMVHLLFIPACPFWSQCLFPLDILVVYGLIAHGNRVDA